MISLADQKPFGMGSHRVVYKHPDKSDRCLKVMVGDWRECDRRKRALWLSRMLRPKRYFHESLSEEHFSRDLRKRVGEEAWEFVAQAYGMVATDLGDGLEVDLVSDSDGKLSLSLKAYLLQQGLTAECEEAIERFWEGVAKHGIFLQGRPDNVSIRQLEDGTCQLIAIDGFGLPQAIPLARWFGFARRRFVEKRRRKQKKEIEKILEARKSGADLGKKGMSG